MMNEKMGSVKKNIQTHKTELGKRIFQQRDSALVGGINTPRLSFLSPQQIRQFQLDPLLLLRLILSLPPSRFSLHIHNGPQSRSRLRRSQYRPCPRECIFLSLRFAFLLGYLPLLAANDAACFLFFFFFLLVELCFECV